MSQDTILMDLLVLKRTLVITVKMKEGLQVQEKGNAAGDVAEKIKDKRNESLMLSVCVCVRRASFRLRPGCAGLGHQSLKGISAAPPTESF